MSMGGYPPGVTGHEWQIAGPAAAREEERTVLHECEGFEEPFDGTVVVELTYWDRYSPIGVVWECPQCGTEIETEEEADDGFEG